LNQSLYLPVSRELRESLAPISVFWHRSMGRAFLPTLLVNLLASTVTSGV
jgi:hypothetical protein